MSYLREKLLKMRDDKLDKEQAYLINDQDDQANLKDNYVESAKVGTIVAFRLLFEAKSGAKLMKVISGMIKVNDTEKEYYVTETRNGLEYVTPYKSIVWVKTGDRWPRGVYEEMKQGAQAVDVKDRDDYLEMGSLDMDDKTID